METPNGMESVASGNANYLSRAWSAITPASERYLPNKFAQSGAVGYMRVAYGMAPKAARAILAEVEPIERRSSRVSYANAHTERSSSSGVGSVPVSFWMYARVDVDRQVARAFGWDEAERDR